MKILIVDDEVLTREGIISNIDWDRLGIDEIYEADDGYHGLEMARLYNPDIILSDVRMPRMNGIDMARELHKLLPASSIIFMSGYSDKEYLKEAIKLKAVSYVEKPIDASEIESSIKSALEEQAVTYNNLIRADYHSKYFKGKLGLKIIYPVSKENLPEYTKQFEELGYEIKPGVEFTTLIITLKSPVSNISDQQANDLYAKLKELSDFYKLNHIPAIKNDEYIIVHFFANKSTEASISYICSHLAGYLKKDFHFYIAVGKTVRGFKNVYESYNQAVALLQSSFFYEYNSIIGQELNTAQRALDQSLYTKFCEALQQLKEEAAIQAAEGIYRQYRNSQHILPGIAKDMYYKLFATLIQTASKLHIPDFYESDSVAVLDFISRDKNLNELHELLTDKIHLLFAAADSSQEENPTVHTIKEFISKHYNNENLSVKDISEHVYLSSTYVCTLFKNETGKTLNQYLTEFRIEKAKDMLRDPKYKISEISIKTGYSDGNYFSKIFKKIVELSPSEYRERFGR